MKKHRKMARALLMLVAVCFLGLIGSSVYCFAADSTSTDDETFSNFYTKLEGWVKGSLGKIIAVGAFTVGLAGAIVRQTLMPAVVGLGIAAALGYGPEVIESILTAFI